MSLKQSMIWFGLVTQLHELNNDQYFVAHINIRSIVAIQNINNIASKLGESLWQNESFGNDKSELLRQT